MWSLRMWMATLSASSHEVHYAVWHMLLENSTRKEVVSCRYLYKTHGRSKFTIDFNIIEFFLEIGAVVKLKSALPSKNVRKTFLSNETTEKMLE